MSYLTAFWRRQRVCVTGGGGFLGRVLCRRLMAMGCRTVLVPRRQSYDLTCVENVRRMYHDSRPDIVFHLAAEVGGIGANRQHPGRFFYANMAMGLHLIEEARKAGVQSFVQVGTVCSYPKITPVPFQEADLWEGYPEETNAPYGIAKRALLAMLQAYRAEYGFDGAYVLPANLYGPGDNFDLETSHVIPALIRKIHDATIHGDDLVGCWGSGRPTREFIYVDDAAKALLRVPASDHQGQPINIGTGKEISIHDLATIIAQIFGFEGQLQWDESQPDGQPRRRLNISRATRLLNWQAGIDLTTGLKRTVEWWVDQCAHSQETPPRTDFDL